MTRNKDMYRDIGGNELPFGWTSRHHIVFERADYIGPEFKNHPDRELFLAYRGLIVQRMSLSGHQALHVNVEPPIIPNTVLMRGMVVNQRGYERATPKDRLESTIEYLGAIMLQGNDLETINDALELQYNFQRQQRYIELGGVALIKLEK